MTEKWRDQWVEIHRQESEQLIAKLAIEKAYRRYEWWDKFNHRDEWQEEQDRPNE